MKQEDEINPAREFFTTFQLYDSKSLFIDVVVLIISLVILSKC